MRRTQDQPGKRTTQPKAPKRSGKPPRQGNTRLGEQTRKILGKHYANKYRVR